MVRTRIWRRNAFFLSLALLACVLGICLGLRNSREVYTHAQAVETLPALGKQLDRATAELLEFAGEPVALDTETGTVFVSADPALYPDAEALARGFRIPGEDRSLYLTGWSGELWKDVRENRRLRLVMADGDRNWTAFQVAVTPLPVMDLHGRFLHYNEERESTYQGHLRLVTPDGREEHSDVCWHVRGKTSAREPKKPWKLELQTGSGENNPKNLLDLGEESDWILNPMNLDDTKLREKLFLNLWNEMAQDSPWNTGASQGEYTEVLLNGRYMGLYLLQRRIDPDFLGLSDRDILLKGSRLDTVTCPEEAYIIESSPLSPEDTWALMVPVWSGQDFSSVDQRNLVDLNLFIQFLAGWDNTGLKNVYYALLEEPDGYRVVLVPWDTDLSFGLDWEDGVVYAPEDLISGDFLRMEYEPMLAQFPELEAEMAARWQELRQNVLSEQRIFSEIHSLLHTTAASGAAARDRQVWGTKYGGVDTPEALEDFITRRLQYLDTLYS